MKPVAWIQTWEGLEDGFKHTVNFERIGDNDIPLYTAPRELSDDEIVDIWGCAEYSIDHDYDGAIKFARAILKKASEHETE
jgi:hypothetical protein